MFEPLQKALTFSDVEVVVYSREIRFHSALYISHVIKYFMIIYNFTLHLLYYVDFVLMWYVRYLIWLKYDIC